MRFVSSKIVRVLMACTFGVLVSCYSFKAGQIPKDVKTFSVAFFANRAALVNPLLSQQFTEKLKQKFLSESYLSLIKSQGDYSLEGFIVDYNVTPVAIQSSQQAATNRLTITINVKFSNNKDSKLSYENNFSRFADFNANENFASVEQTLTTTIVAQIVDDVFNRCTSNW
ncbi:MAG: LptE family protein [Bacteroidetes bacterium]|nr:LptE family protein [Bacteroidota bacterium]